MKFYKMMMNKLDSLQKLFFRRFKQFLAEDHCQKIDVKNRKLVLEIATQFWNFEPIFIVNSEKLSAFWS